MYLPIHGNLWSTGTPLRSSFPFRGCVGDGDAGIRPRGRDFVGTFFLIKRIRLTQNNTLTRLKNTFSPNIISKYRCLVCNRKIEYKPVSATNLIVRQSPPRLGLPLPLLPPESPPRLGYSPSPTSTYVSKFNGSSLG